MLDVGVGSSCEWEKHQGELISVAKRYVRERGWSGVFGVCCESLCVCVCVITLCWMWVWAAAVNGRSIKGSWYLQLKGTCVSVVGLVCLVCVVRVCVCVCACVCVCVYHFMLDVGVGSSCEWENHQQGCL